MSHATPDVTADATPEAPPAPDLTPDAGSVTMFTTSWCGYCRRLRSQLDREGVPFTEIDIEANPEHVDFVERVNDGNRTVPTVLFPDGSAATNPSLAEVRARLSA
ncbi:mycoredoxin [Humibacillus xanthopallidus]|uniref:Mycoredoxin n=2 Tax=Humibacillus xanthopallidus TaxID=412689 RepID=A0A543PRZ8_9MICO|nr:mycoredoxin [Humibacillus xanthopallidus]